LSFKPIPINPKKSPKIWVYIVVSTLILGVVGYFAYQYLFSPGSRRWLDFSAFKQNRDDYAEILLLPGMLCGDAPFAFPTTGAIFGLWSQSYRPGHIHAGLDIFSATEPGATPVYAAYPGYLTRKADWISTVIIRHPNDPLEPGRQIWTYYTHMADDQGEESFVSEDFPTGTAEVFVEAGQFLGYQGNYSGNPANPTGLHLHFSVVKDDGNGSFLNELEIKNTYDPSPYLNLAVNHENNPETFPICEDEITFENWDLVKEYE